MGSRAISPPELPLPELTDFGPEVIAAGRLIGLVTGTTTSDVGVATDWFEKPGTYLESMDARLGQLAALARHLLGDPETPPTGFGDLAWYPVPGEDGDNAAATTARIVATPYTDGDPIPASGELGAGLHWSKTYAAATVGIAAYLPLVSFDSNGLHPKIASTALHLRIDVASAGSSTFPELAFDVTFGIGTDGVAMPSGTLTAGATQCASLAQALASTDAMSGIASAIEQGLGAWLAEKPGAGAKTIGAILTSAGLLTAQGDNTYVVDLEGLGKKTSAQVALDFATCLLDALANLTEPLIALPPAPHGGISVVHTTDGAYGIRVASEIVLGGSAKPTASGAPTQLTLSLGSWMTGEKDGANWMTASGAPADGPAAGLTVLVLASDGNGGLKFKPGFELNSAGIKLRGGGKAPLVNVRGWTIGGVELRGSYAYPGGTWGAAARVDDAGIPLGSDFDKAQQTPGKGNPVAATLLAAGPSDGDKPAASPVNPAFSVEGGYLKGGKVSVELFDAKGKASKEVWIPVQRRFGPLTCKKVGIEVDTTADPPDPVVGFGVDGGVKLGPLDVELDELTVSAHVKNLGQTSGYGLDLKGIEVTYSSGQVELSGGLVKVTGDDGAISYDGEALLKAEKYALSALGAYGTTADGATSLFVFARLDAVLGGPAFFYVTGLAAGFGYNRALRIPAQDQVQSFPLVSGVTDPAALGAGAGPAAAPPAPQDALAKLGDWVPAQRGEYWLAVGVQFTTYEIVKSNALLVVEFGDDLLIAVLGVASLTQPVSGDPWVSADLDLEVVVRPREGSLLAAAVLSPASYVLTEDAHLTGGFAFAAWFGANEHAGDFVLTLGGYHPAFVVPDHYPTEPRVGIDWHVSDQIAVVGEAYFALTPGAMMAGASVQATFEAGPLKAWLKADADLIVFWHPFYFDATVSISVGVSVHIHVLFVDVTLSVEIGVDFELFGPPIGFQAHIDWYIVSFTIGTGEKAGPPEIGWAEFKELLPTKTRVAPPQAELFIAAGDSPQPASNSDYLSVAARGGLQRSSVVSGVTHWLMRSRDFAVTVDSAYPPTEITVPATGFPETTYQNSGVFSVRPVGLASEQYTAPLSICVYELHGEGGNPPDPAGTFPLASVDWSVAGEPGAFPAALWGVPVDSASPALVSGDQSVHGVGGATLGLVQDLPDACTPEMNVAAVFADRPVTQAGLPIGPADPAVGTAPVRSATVFDSLEAIDTDPALSNRDGLFSALASVGVTAWTDDRLGAMQRSPGDAFADVPLEMTA